MLNNNTRNVKLPALSEENAKTHNLKKYERKHFTGEGHIVNTVDKPFKKPIMRLKTKYIKATKATIISYELQKRCKI